MPKNTIVQKYSTGPCTTRRKIRSWSSEVAAAGSSTWAVVSNGDCAANTPSGICAKKITRVETSR